jgi:uncharacterized protein DUF6049
MPRPPDHPPCPGRPRAARLRGPVLAVLASLCALAAAVAGGGPAAAGVAGAAGQSAGSALPVSLTILNVSPDYLTAKHPVVVSGTVTNTSGSALAGLKVQLRSSHSALTSRDALQIYADSATAADSPVTGTAVPLIATLAPKATATWSIVLRPAQAGLTSFGVYPLAAEVVGQDGTALIAERTFLPYWPGKARQNPKRQGISWIWPLIGRPDRSACGGLLTNRLAASLTPRGRLGGLLAAGRDYSARTHLTWAVDPELLSSAALMTKPYQTGGTPSCGGRSSRPASQAAAAWLAEVRSALTSDPGLLTPYADVDAAALIHRGLNDDLATAISLGRTAAAQALAPGQASGSGGSAVTTGFTAEPADGPVVPGSRLNGSLAWPAGGIASFSVISGLAAAGIHTAVLNSSVMTPAEVTNYTPSAVSSTPSGVGPRMRVLISDSTISQILGKANVASTSAGAAFSVRQRVLAETAMIAAEQPDLARSLVIAPPRRWDPPPQLAADLLASTSSAPWLRPVSLSELAATAPNAGQVPMHLRHVTSRDELKRGLLRQIRQLGTQAGLLQSILVRKNPDLVAASLGPESSAWRGGGRRAATAASLVRQVSSYVTSQLRAVQVIGPQRVTLGGLSGTLPVSISNRLPVAVRVQLVVGTPAGGRIEVKLPSRDVTVAARTDQTLKLRVRAAAVGSTTIQLALTAPDGARLPAAEVTLTVQATHFGTLALYIIGIALAVFLLASVRRALRRGRGDQPATAGAGDPDAPAAPGGADSVGADRSDDDPSAEDPDEYASAPGRTDGG